MLCPEHPVLHARHPILCGLLLYLPFWDIFLSLAEMMQLSSLARDIPLSFSFSILAAHELLPSAMKSFSDEGCEYPYSQIKIQRLDSSMGMILPQRVDKS